MRSFSRTSSEEHTSELQSLMRHPYHTYPAHPFPPLRPSGRVRSLNAQDASASRHRRRLRSCTEKPSSCGLHAEAIESAVLVKPYTNPLGYEAQRCPPLGQSDKEFIDLGLSGDRNALLLQN